MSELKSLSDLLKEFAERNPGNENAIKCCQNDLDQIYKTFEGEMKNIKKEQVQKSISDWLSKNSSKIKVMSDYSSNQSDSFLRDFFSIMMKGVWLAFEKKVPRSHQMICLWFNIHSKKTILEVKTGEGKTMIVALTALFYALRGKKVDVFTSSSTLAMTETQPNSSVRKLFDIFGISLSDVCRERTIQPHKPYESQVIYGTSFQFQADYLRKFFNGDLQFFKDRNFDQNHVAILDEVDALLIDRMRDSTRLSSQKPLFQCIKALLIVIHEVKKQLIDAKCTFCGALDDITILGEKVDIKMSVNDQINLQDQDIFIKSQKKQVLSIVKKALETKIRYMFPNYLLNGYESYINLMLPRWIDSSYQICQYKEDVHFTICKDTHQIIPIDISTGTYQKKTKWMNGVHQFLELKYGFDPSVDSIVTNYESNLIFFNRYVHYLYGMTGTISKTIGKTEEGPPIFEGFLKFTYKVNIYKIPTAKKRLLSLETPKFYSDQLQWSYALYRDSKKYSQKRMVLIIFHTIKEAKQFVEKFPEKQKYNIVQLHDHDKYFESMKKDVNKKNTIIVSTNLGGRGTDIEITNKDILQNGGLHVMMTYFAPNWRIEEQAFGRAGRNGQPGSGSFYLNIDKEQYSGMKLEDSKQFCQSQFDDMVKTRAKWEKQNFEKAQISIANQQIKKNLLDAFYDKYLKSSQQKMIKLNEIIKERGRIINKCKSQLIQYYQTKMQSDCAEQQWGIFLKRKIPERQEGEQTNLVIDFRQFVKQFDYNKKYNDVNPGFFAICGSKLLQIDEKQSQQLFEKALSKNDKSWVNRYYKLYFQLKRHSNQQLTVFVAQKLVKELKQVCQIIVVQFSLQMAVTSNTKQSQQRKEQVNNLKIFYIDLMCNLQSIAETLAKYVIKKGLKMKMFCKMKKSTKQIPSLNIKGFNHIIDFEIQQIKEKKKQFWQSVWDGICSLVKAIVLTVVAVIATTVALVATPFIAICGGNTGQIWKGVGAAWKKTGTPWKQFLDNLHAIAVVGLSLLTVFVSGGFAIPAVIALVTWMYLNKDQTMQATPQINGQVDGPLKLISIKGQGKLSQDIQKTIRQFRLKLEGKQQKINETFKIIYSRFEELKTKRTPQKVQQMEDMAFSESNLNQKLFGQNQQSRKESPSKQSSTSNYKEKKSALVSQILMKGKTIQQVNEQLSSKQKQSKQTLQKINLVGDQTVTQISDKLHQTMLKTQQQINKNIVQGKDVQLDVNNFHKNVPHDQQELILLVEDISKNMNKNITISKVTQLDDISTVMTNRNFNFISKDFLETQAQKIKVPIEKKVNLQEQIEQIHEIFEFQKLSNSPLSLNPQQIKNPAIKKIIKNFQDNYIDGCKNETLKKWNNQIKEERKKYDKQVEQYALNTMNQVALLAEEIKVTPVHDAKKINNYIFYQEIVKQKCLFEKINYIEVNSQEQLIEALKQKKGQEVVIVFDKTVVYQTQQKTIFKGYEKESNKHEKLKKQMASALPKAKFMFADQTGSSQCGSSIIADLNKFIFNQDISQESDALTDIKAQKQYLRSLTIKAITINFSKDQYDQIKKNRKQQGSLPQFFIPFQLDRKSKQFEHFGNQTNDMICKAIFFNENDKLKYRQLVQNVRSQLQAEQTEIIKEKYPQFVKFVQRERKKPNRR